MGRRSRHSEQSRSSRATPPAQQRPSNRPPAPWGTFPLTEVTVFVAIVGALVGWLIGGTAGTATLDGSLILGSLAGLELAIREHFTGHRSHSSLLSGLVAFTVLGALFVTVPGSTLSPIYRLAIGAAIFAATLPLFRRGFKRRSGGVGFR